MPHLSRLSFLLLVSSAALLTSACGGGGSSSSGSAADTNPRFTVSVQTSGGGEAAPGEQQVDEGERARISLTPDSGFRLLSASGCGGDIAGEEYVTEPVVADCLVSVEFAPLATVSGQLLPAPDTAIDHTINDKRAPLESNSQCADAQAIGNRATAHGFVSAVATGGDTEQEHYAENSNPRDYYRVTLSAGQVVELEKADEGDGNKLELRLWNSDCSQQLDASTDGGDTQRVSSLLGGESVVEVRAEAGISKYVMRVTTAWDTSHSTAEDLQTLSEQMPAFNAGEVILSFNSSAGAQAHSRLAEALEKALGLQLSFRHEQADRATLARIQSPTGSSVLPKPEPTDALEDLRDANPTAYEALNTLRVVDFLGRQAGVRFAEPNYLLSAQREPNDPFYTDQWHYEQIGLPEAWDHTVGDSTGEHPVIVAVLDSGVYLGHDDLQDKLVVGWDFHDNDNDPDDHNSENDSSWHGTHVSGTVASSTNNNNGVAGVSWAAKIMPVRVLGDAGGSRYDVMQGVRFAAGLVNDSGTVPERPADILNLSLGGGGYSSTEQSLYDEIRNLGILVAAAAGNDASDQPMYPAAYDGVISVSATNCDKERASYSNFGPTISLAAPGGDSGGCVLLNTDGAVLSTVGSGSSDGSNDSRLSSFGELIGTSMASPHVAGVMALMRGVHPSLSPSEFELLLINEQITDDLGEAGRDDQFGYGLINASKAVQAAQAVADGETQFSARVVAEPSTLSLGRESEASLELRQEGDGQAPAVVSAASEAEWLSVAEETVDERGLGTYQVLVDRSVFNEEDAGDHESELVFGLEDNSELRVRVHIRVGIAAESAPVYVLLLDPANREAVYSTVAQRNSEGELGYQLGGIAPGDYILVAGSDIDVDDLICQPGEICGGYPESEAREVVSVAEHDVSGLDFAIDILSRFQSFDSTSAEGIARR